MKTIIEDGVVVKKGARPLAMFENVYNTTVGASMAKEKDCYWAKVKVSSLSTPLLIKSKYNFSKGAKVRVKYSPQFPDSGELVVDWE